MRLNPIVHFRLLPAALCLLSPLALAQQTSSSSTGEQVQQQQQQDVNPTARPRVAQIEAGGASVTAETSEPLFEVAAALNACGYDADLDRSLPVRQQVRADMNAALAASEAARASRDALCAYIDAHRLRDSALDIGQYISLSLYLSPPPDLTPNVGENELPPQAAQVVNVLPLLRNFSREIDLHFIWLQHRATYEGLIAQLHDPLSHMIIDTNVALHMPVSSYDGRRFLILIEPMLSPAVTNARIYGSDYIIVTSPDRTATGVPVRMDEIRHIYLHYIVDPMVYSRGSAMERLQPMLRSVAAAPLDFVYKSDAVALITECIIKAIEARLYRLPTPEPPRPKSVHTRTDEENYAIARAAYDRETQIAQARLVDLDEQQGWVLVGYFYTALGQLGRNGGLADEMAPMIYGIDLQTAMHHASQIVFLKNANAVDPLGPARQPHTLEGLDLAEMDLAKGDIPAAETLAAKELAQPSGDHGHALYILARIDLLNGKPEKAFEGFTAVLSATKDPRTLAWSHIYLGRLYDSMDPPDRTKAVAEYNAALASRDSRPDTRTAAEAGLKQPFALPHSNAQPADDEDIEALSKKAKEDYKPDTK